MTDDFLIEPRAVKPRARTYPRRPVVAIHGDTWLDENGQIGDTSTIIQYLKDMPPHLFAAQGAADLLARFNKHWRPDPQWQWKVTEQEKAITRAGGVTLSARATNTIHYFGFKGHAKTYHRIVDPVSMYGHSLDTIWPGEQSVLVRLLRWGVALRDFCDENSMEVRPTIGALSGQFLTDRRFYPYARRKVPWKTNDRARQNLPGNHYALSVNPSSIHEFTAWYLDQRRAHHYHARTTALPDADSLYALGHFIDLSDIAFDDVVPNFHGLYCLHLEVPTPRNPMFHWIKPESRYDFVFSNELPLLLDLGYKVKGVIAAWGSNQTDRGIARYATFADRQLDRYDDAPWLKPLLLSTYGMLAIRASWAETIFKLAKRGEPVSIRTGHHQLEGTLVRAPRRLEPGIANVIHRGMIEAATRADSIGLAHWLTGRGHRVLSIYADAVMVETDDDLPLPTLAEPWRLKRTLNHLQFVSKQAFMSGEMTKLPGVGRELKAYARNSNGEAPHRIRHDILTGKKIRTERKI